MNTGDEMPDDRSLSEMLLEYEKMMPDEIISMLQTCGWRATLGNILRREGIHGDISTDIQNGLHFVLLGIGTSDDKVAGRLREVHGIPEDKIDRIVADIDSEIFSVLARILQQMEDEDLQDA